MSIPSVSSAQAGITQRIKIPINIYIIEIAPGTLRVHKNQVNNQYLT